MESGTDEEPMEERAVAIDGRQLISGDTHLEIDSRRWATRVPEKHRDRVPKVVRLPDGGDAWLVEGAPLREVPMDLYGGKGRANWKPFGQSYETTAGTGSPEQRLSEQDRDGVDVEVLFPGVAGPALWRNIKDDDAYLSVVRAYNGYLAEEYCAVNPRRLIGVGVIPWTGLKDALSELERCHQMGLGAILLGTFPNGSGVPKKEDDEFWSAAMDTQMAVTIHQELDRNGPRGGSLLEYPNAKPRAVARMHPSARVVEQATKFARSGGVNAMQLALSGVFDRFPELQVFFAETQIGWIPFFMEMADLRYQRHLPWVTQELGWTPVERLPSEYVRENCYWGFQRDRTGVLMREHMGVDRLIWATDFPHQESEWPESAGVLDVNFEGVPEDEVKLMTSGNVARFFHLAA